MLHQSISLEITHVWVRLWSKQWACLINSHHIVIGCCDNRGTNLTWFQYYLSHSTWVIHYIADSYWSSCTPPTKPPTPWIIPSIMPNQSPSLPPVALVNNPIPHSQPDPCWLVSWLAGWLRIPKEYPISKTFPPLGGPNIIRQILTTIYFLCDNPAAVELYIWTKEKPSVAAVFMQTHCTEYKLQYSFFSFQMKANASYYITVHWKANSMYCSAINCLKCNSVDQQYTAVQKAPLRECSVIFHWFLSNPSSGIDF